MKRLMLLALVSALSLLVVCGGPALSQKNGDKADVKDFMRAKLVHMQKVLEGITTEDYDLIRKNANELTLLSHATQWRIFQTDAYQQHSSEFRRATGAGRGSQKEESRWSRFRLRRYHDEMRDLPQVRAQRAHGELRCADRLAFRLAGRAAARTGRVSNRPVAFPPRKPCQE